MPKRTMTTEKTEAGVRLVVIDTGSRYLKLRLSYRVTSLRGVDDQDFTDRDQAEAAFIAEVAASLADPRLGPIIN